MKNETGKNVFAERLLQMTNENKKEPYQIAADCILDIAKQMNFTKGRAFGMMKEWSMNDLTYVRDNPSKFWDIKKKYDSSNSTSTTNK